MLVWLVLWPLVTGASAGAAIAGLVANPVIGAFLAVVAAAQIAQLLRYGPAVLIARRRR
jgi:hypothetical protein